MEQNLKKTQGLPENANRELKPGEKYEPILSPPDPDEFFWMRLDGSLRVGVLNPN